MTKKSLVTQVTDRLALEQVKFDLSPELAEAFRLSDVFESVKPVEHVLPLDAMAGFHRATEPVESKPEAPPVYEPQYRIR